MIRSLVIVYRDCGRAVPGPPVTVLKVLGPLVLVARDGTLAASVNLGPDPAPPPPAAAGGPGVSPTRSTSPSQTAPAVTGNQCQAPAAAYASTESEFLET